MRRTDQEAMRLRLGRLGKEWDSRLRREWLDGRPAVLLARDYGLEPETLEAVLPVRLGKRKSA